MRLYTLLKEVEIDYTNIADFSAQVEAITDRSDRVRPGCVFVCVSGIRHDGHDYIDRAAARGAAVVVAERPTDALRATGIPYVITRSTRRALARMWSAWYGHPERDLTLYAFTGTNGKSSSSAILRSILEHAGYPTGLIGSVSNEFGNLSLPTNPMTTPDPELLFSLLSEMRGAGARAVVLEASSHALALDRLHGLTFACGVFTNLCPEHLDFHPTMQDYAAAKARLFGMCKTGLANRDDRWYPAVTERASCPVRTFSVTQSADYTAKEVEFTPEGGICYLLMTRKELFRVESALPGMFSVYNTLSAAAAAYEAGVDAASIAAGIAAVKVVPGRMERIPNDRGISVYIDYAHTPAALENVLTELRRYHKGRLITVFGCGGDRDKQKRPFMGRVAAALSDLTVVTTDNPRTEDPDAIIADILSGMEGGKFAVVREREKAIAYALREASPGDTVLFAGKGHEEYQILPDGEHPFSEKEIIHKILTE